MLVEIRHDYARSLMRVALTCLPGDAEAARDMVQETLIRAWRRCGQFRGQSELFPWLKSILQHLVLDRLRGCRTEPLDLRQAREDASTIEVALQALSAGAGAGPDGILQRRQHDAIFRRCMQALATDDPQAALVIRWITEDELTPRDIAVLLDRSDGATRQYISQCRKKARHHLREWYLLMPTSQRKRA